MKIKQPSILTDQKGFAKIMILLLIACFILIDIFKIEQITMVVNIIILLFIILSLPKLTGIVAIITYSMTILSLFLLVTNDLTVSKIIEGARTNLSLIAIIIFAPILGISIRTGNYIDSLRNLHHKIGSNMRSAFLGTMLMSHILGFILNVGSITINHYLSQTFHSRSVRLIANAINRGFTTSIYWSPYFAAMALVIGHLDIRWSNIALALFGFSILSMLISLIMERPRYVGTQLNFDEVSKEIPSEDFSKNDKKRIIELIFLIVLIMSIVLFIEKTTSYGMVQSISIAAIVFPILWSIYKKSFSIYKRELTNYINFTIPNLRQEIVLFLTAGFFSSIYIQSPYNEHIVIFLQEYFGFSTIILTTVIALFIIIPAVFGVHPVVIVTVLVTSFIPSQFNMSSEYFAVILLSSWGLSNSISPITASNNLLASVFKEELITISLRWNWLYVVIMAAILPFYLYIINHL